jgi:hypothetical protein
VISAKSEVAGLSWAIRKLGPKRRRSRISEWESFEQSIFLNRTSGPFRWIHTPDQRFVQTCEEDRIRAETWVFFTQITMEAAEDPSFLDAMKKANIKGALVGVESVTPEGLKDVYKDFNSAGDGLIERLRTFRRHI